MVKRVKEMVPRPASIRVDGVIQDVAGELRSNLRTHEGYASFHEGMGVLREELDELWDEIKRKAPNVLKVQVEATQVAAVAAEIAAIAATIRNGPHEGDDDLEAILKR